MFNFKFDSKQVIIIFWLNSRLFVLMRKCFAFNCEMINIRTALKTKNMSLYFTETKLIFLYHWNNFVIFLLF